MKYLSMFFCILQIISAEIIAEEWPKVVIHPSGTEITLYQPQVESFDKVNLEFRSAVMINTPKQEDPIFGAVWVKTKILTDRDTREISLDDVRVTDAKFPNQDSTKIEELKKFLSGEIPKWELDITIDQLIAYLDEDKKKEEDKFKNDPPEIICVDHPAVLITIDGEPKFKDLGETDLLIVVNTPFFIAKQDFDEIYYLKGGVLWYKSNTILDGYEFTKEIPDELLDYVLKENPDEYKDVNPDTIKVKPEIIVRTKPAELIETDGDPELGSIEGT